MKIIILLLLLAGCVATPYQALNHGRGFTEVQLKPNMFRISYEGGTSAIQSADFAMLRAAEVTLENGFSHFTIVKEKDGKRETFSIDNHYFLYGSHYVQSSKTHSTVVIHAYRETMPNLELFDASYVVDHIRQSYGI